MQPPSLSLEQSNDLATLLSLDIVAPFWSDVLLNSVSPDVEGFVSLLRAVITAARRRHEAHADEVSDVLLQMVDALKGVGDGVQGELFESWSRHAYMGSHSDQPQLSGWDIVLVESAYAQPPEIRGDAGSGLAQWAHAYRKRIESLGQDPRIKTQRAAPLSRWDFSMFARHGLSEEAFNHPLDRVVAMTSVFSMLASGESLFHHWATDQQQKVCAAGDAILRRLQVWMPGPLDLPTFRVGRAAC